MEQNGKQKNIYRHMREAKKLSRLAASELLYIDDDRLIRIESNKSSPRPEEVVAMSRVYEQPILCNYYCTHECDIGKKMIPEIEVKDLSQIVLEMLASLNVLNQRKERLIEIAIDGKIGEAEEREFETIRNELDKISTASDSLRLWVEQIRIQKQNKNNS